MAKEFAKEFYASKAWHDCREGYLKSVGGLCERCLRSGAYVPGVIVHHKIRLTPQTILDPAVALNWENLECLCLACHNNEHMGEMKEGTRRKYRVKTRYRIDEFGRVII